MALSDGVGEEAYAGGGNYRSAGGGGHVRCCGLGWCYCMVDDGLVEHGLRLRTCYASHRPRINSRSTEGG